MFVKLALKEVDGDFEQWLKHIGFWNNYVANRVKRAQNLLPVDLELNLRGLIGKKVNKLCLLVLKQIKSSPGGITFEEFDLSCLDCSTVEEIFDLEQQVEDVLLGRSDCACEVLMKLGLVIKDQIKQLILATKWSSDPRIMDITGLRSLS